MQIPRHVVSLVGSDFQLILASLCCLRHARGSSDDDLPVPSFAMPWHGVFGRKTHHESSSTASRVLANAPFPKSLSFCHLCQALNRLGHTAAPADFPCAKGWAVGRDFLLAQRGGGCLTIHSIPGIPAPNKHIHLTWQNAF